MSSTTGPAAGGHRQGLPWRRTLGLLAGVTAVAALAGVVQLLTGTYTPPVSDLEPLGLHSWMLPALWLAATVAVPCAAVALQAARGSPWTGRAAALAGVLLALELVVQVPFVGLDPLQALMGAVAALLITLGLRGSSARTNAGTRSSGRSGTGSSGKSR